MIAGVDEVGRGALFGPVVAAAVILSPTALDILDGMGVTDSKKLSAKKRITLDQAIRSSAIDVKVGYATVTEIDEINILQASLLAMKRAILKLDPQPKLCLIDGRSSVPNLAIPQETIIQGDSTSLLIAAASIVAKVWRDDLIVRWAAKYPHYELSRNKGYGTKAHRLAIQQYGASVQHRQSFKLF